MMTNTTNYNEINKQSYNKIAELFSDTRAYIWPDIDLFSRFIKKGDKVLDLGCGNGRLVEFLKTKNVDYTGLDFSENLIKQAKEKYTDSKFIVGDILNEQTLPNEKYDVILMVAVLNHFSKEQHEKVISNVKKMLKPRGLLLMLNWDLWATDKTKSVWHNFNTNIKNLKSKTFKHKLISFFQIFKNFKNVKTLWHGGNKDVELFYYAFTKHEMGRLLKKQGFRILDNFYVGHGKKTNILKAKNIITVVRVK